jgi:hypothetical protein
MKQNRIGSEKSPDQGYIPMKDRIQAIPNHFLYHTITAFRG